jgi:hypothetical protein
MTTWLTCSASALVTSRAAEKGEMTQRGSKDIRSCSFRFANPRFLVLFLGLISLSELAAVASFARDHRSSHRLSSRSAHNRALVSPTSGRSTVNTLPRLVVTNKKAYRPPPDKATAADALILAVQQFVAAGETDDVAQRTIYLAPQVFFYGYNRTREQAAKQMTYLNRLWPQRRYAAPESVDVYAIPNRPDAYKVVSVYEYEMINRDQDRLTGKARLTCIFEYGTEGPRIVGVNEKLLSETTRLDRGSWLSWW